METSEGNATYLNYNGPNGCDGDNVNYNDSKTIPPYQFNVVPFQIETNLDFIEIFEDGTTLLGSSNINGKYWNGSIWSFKDVDHAPLKEKALTGFGLEFGVTCGAFIGNAENVIIGDEGGGISTIKFQDISNTVHCMPLFTSYCHDRAVTSLSVSKDSQKTVASSADASITVLENESLVQFKKFSPAHGREVTDVSVSKFHTDLMFASSSLDGSALMWDIREEKPAFCIKEDESEPLSAIKWKSEHEIVVASNFGSLSLYDVRNHTILHKEPVLDVPIVNISFNKYGLLAVAGQWNEVIVWDFNTNKAIYRDSKHTDVVRGLCWHPINNKLYSCGNKTTILKHDVDLSTYMK